jgi:serine/threonine protein kinase
MDIGTVGNMLETMHPGGLPEEAIFRILNGILHALDYLHSQGIIHRFLLNL